MNTENTTVAISTEKKSRKLNFRGNFSPPETPFTISALMARFNFAKSDVKRPTKIAAYLHLKKLLKNGKIEIVGKKKIKKTRGRAQIVYKKCECTAENSQITNGNEPNTQQETTVS